MGEFMRSTTEIAHLYENVAGKIAHLIRKRTLRGGERIPSIRKLSRREKVSISTVLQAYGLLEDQGLIEARPQSGYYVRLHPRELPPEPAITNPPSTASVVNVTTLIASIQDAIDNPEIIPFGGATPGPDHLPFRKLNRAIAHVVRKNESISHFYGQPQGNEELRRQIAKRSIDWGCSLSPEELLITTGCTEAIQLCLRAVASPGDTIAVESPTYYGFLQMIEANKMKAVEISSDPQEGMNLNALASALKKHSIKACMVISNFSNPLGSCMPDEKKKKLVDMLARNEIPLIEDDIYGDIYFGPERPGVCKAYDKKGLVLLCSSFSKVLSPGLRVGWTAPGRFRDEVRRLKFVNTMTTCAISQLAIAEILRNGGYDHQLRKNRKAYYQQVQNVTQGVAKYFPAGTRVTRPSGGFVLWVELPKKIDSLELYRRAALERISIVPGIIFSAKGRYQNFIRLNCAHSWSDKLEQALFVLGRLVCELNSR
jgi:DNA-binding transcriptional MocR family regulator